MRINSSEEGEGGDEAPADGEGDEGANKEIPSDTEEEEEVKVPPKNLTELDRLTYVVRSIENDCHVVPQGSFKLTPNHEVRRNEAFKGLPIEKALDIGSYHHFRNVQHREKKDQIERDDAVF